jgi:hypothetical protein
MPERGHSDLDESVPGDSIILKLECIPSTAARRYDPRVHPQVEQTHADWQAAYRNANLKY